jgi:tyrosyl-tRNA synthetase
MASSKENFISVDDTEEEIYRKLKKAYCKAGDVEENPILALFRYHIFPRYEIVVIERPEKFGGNLTYASYSEMERAFVAEAVHPMDLKNSAAKYINEILDPVRKVLL